MAFIEKLDGPALNLSPEEFEGYMQGRRAPSKRGSERQKMARETQDQLEDLKGRQEKVDQGINALKEQLQHWVQSVKAQIDEVTSQSALAQEEIKAQSEFLQSHSVSTITQADVKDQSVLLLDGQESNNNTCLTEAE